MHSLIDESREVDEQLRFDTDSNLNQLNSNAFGLNKIVMQPTSFCNVNCRYCYLAHRDSKNRMSVEVAKCVADGVALLDHPVTIVWHSGEPLAVGQEHLSQLFNPLEAVRNNGMLHHAIQTNATLINERWCDFFKTYSVDVGISIDGPRWANTERIDRKENEIFDRVIEGIEQLKKNSIEFSAICVVNDEMASRVEELYDFFVELGCKSVGFNMLEKDGVADVGQMARSKALEFWSHLFECWSNNPVIEIREFRNVLKWMNSFIDRKDLISDSFRHDIFPTISTDGDLRVLSPEFVDTKSNIYSDFVVGNVVTDGFINLTRIASQQPYVRDFLAGVSLCEKSCDYYIFCKGGQASNKFSENETLVSTETQWCRNRKMALVDSVVQAIWED